MQLTPRYLVSNRSIVVANEAGFVTEYRPVYQRHLQVYKGIDNVLEFKLLNADQKPIDLSGYTPKFQAYDSNNSLVIEHDGVQVTSDGSTPIKGVFKVTVTENDLLNIQNQYIKYSIHLVDVNNDATITYSDSHFGNNGIIKISSEAYPGPRNTLSVTTFTEDNVSAGTWNSEAISAEPGINGNEALHTAAIYTDGYVGDVILQATLDNQISNGTLWADVNTLTFDGTETDPSPVNFSGVFSHLRFKTTADPANKISKILVRN